MKFTKPFQGVPDGQIYPVQYQAGDQCPPELLASATALEVIEKNESPAAPVAVAPQVVGVEPPQEQPGAPEPAAAPAAKAGKKK